MEIARSSFSCWFIEDERQCEFHLFRLPLTDDGFSSLGDPLFFVPYSQYPLTFILASDASSSIVGATAPPAPNSDFDGDGTVGIGDFLLFVAQFGLRQGDAGYDARFDLDGDGIIGISDFLLFVNDFGKKTS